MFTALNFIGDDDLEKTPTLINSIDDLSLDLAARVASGDETFALGDRARETINGGRRRFEEYLRAADGYIYGTNTAPGSRAKRVLTPDAMAQQGKTLREFVTLRAGLGGAQMPARTIRLAILARLSNTLSGNGKITLGTASKILEMLSDIPSVPLDGISSSGEVLALTWLMAPLGDLPLRTGEAMALINGSPFATAMVVDAALTGKRRLQLATEILALSIEAARVPVEHYSPQLADLWPDPFYRASLDDLAILLANASDDRLKHQAPVSWRIIPNILAAARRTLSSAEDVAQISLRAVKDNPTFLTSVDGHRDKVVSSGGFHDHQAARAIEAVTSSLADLCVLIGKQVARLIDGEGLGLPRLMVRGDDDGVGTEYFVWTLTDVIDRAQQAAIPVGLNISLEDPAGNQSDIASPVFIAYRRHLQAGSALDDCLTTLATVSALSLKIRNTPAPPALTGLSSLILPLLEQVESTAATCGEPLRNIGMVLRARVEFDKTAHTPNMGCP